MQRTVQAICEAMEKLAPIELAMEWDNVGLQIGDPKREASTVLVTLTLTPFVLEKALQANADMIIAHHPLIFSPLRQIRRDCPQGRLVWELIKNDVALYVSHTNLDLAPKGLNYWLAESFGLQNSSILAASLEPEAGLGRIGQIKATTLGALAKKAETACGGTVRVVGDLTKRIETVAVLGGSGGKYLTEAKSAGADVLITGDISYHQALDAKAIDLSLIDAGHFGTEQIMVPRVGAFLRERFAGELNVIEETSDNPFRF